MLGRRLVRVLNGAALRFKNRQLLPVIFFDGRPNVGDMLNAYLLPKIAGRDIYRAPTNFFPHLLGIGSTISSGSWQSWIWGGGSIDGAVPVRAFDADKITALRGEKTLELVQRHCNCPQLQVPLGDPALLLPMFFMAPARSYEFDVGIVCHFSDESERWIIDTLRRIPNVKQIEVSLDPETFVQELSRCRFVLSSSLHGLIIADAYEIPNKWVRFGDRLLGGTFKFEDYYSTTSTPYERPLNIRDRASLETLITEVANYVEIAAYQRDAKALLAAFPARWLFSGHSAPS